jgi:hypothetical protein
VGLGILFGADAQVMDWCRLLLRLNTCSATHPCVALTQAGLFCLLPYSKPAACCPAR